MVGSVITESYGQGGREMRSTETITKGEETSDRCAAIMDKNFACMVLRYLQAYGKSAAKNGCQFPRGSLSL